MGILHRRFVRVAAVLAVGVTALAPRTSHALVVNFATPGAPGNLSSTSFTDSGVTARGWWSTSGNASSWLPANLYRRNQTNDHGFGVCNPSEAAAGPGGVDCPGPSGGGNINELDNLSEDELISLSLPAGFSWVSVSVSSVDSSETGTLWADSDLVFGAVGLIGDLGVVANFAAGGPIEFDISIPAAFSLTSHLVFEPDFKTGSEFDNDYLVWQAELTPVPLPAALPLFLSALVGLALLGRRQRKKAAA